MKFNTVEDLINLANSSSKKIGQIMWEVQAESGAESLQTVYDRMADALDVMEDAVKRGLEEQVRSRSGLTGGAARKIKQYMQGNKVLAGDTLDAVSKAVATAEVNAAMGTIVATPTAGSSGVLPGCLFSVGPRLGSSRKELVLALFTAGAFGLVIANHASIAGAEGGCQAEIGAASGMAAAAMVELAGGTPGQCADACAIALKNLLGLVCDPVAGLVEVPCVKRNAIGAANALVAADMALAGVTSVIPCDEVIGAMYRVGCAIPVSLRETAMGGLADTPTGRSLELKINGCSSQ